MNKEIDAYLKLVNEFKKNGFSLFLVGGTVRDFLLNKELTDMDAVTDATPNEMKAFLQDADFTFSRMGSVRAKYDGVKFDITTFRKEKSYKDSRHPTEVVFVKSPKSDVERRDFTINAMYMDENFFVLDFYNGKEDLTNKILRMVGNPDRRIQEDPLRIIRAIRFAIDLELEIEPKLEKAILKNIGLLQKLNKDKILQDLKKIKSNNEERKSKYFVKFGINEFLNVVE